MWTSWHCFLCCPPLGWMGFVCPSGNDWRYFVLYCTTKKIGVFPLPGKFVSWSTVQNAGLSCLFLRSSFACYKTEASWDRDGLYRGMFLQLSFFFFFVLFLLQETNYFTGVVRLRILRLCSLLIMSFLCLLQISLMQHMASSSFVEENAKLTTHRILRQTLDIVGLMTGDVSMFLKNFTKVVKHVRSVD